MKSYQRPPNREEYERFLSDLLHHGDRERIARLCEVSPSAISQQLDPYNHDVYSWMYRALDFLWALHDTNPECADVAFHDFCRRYQACRGDEAHAYDEKPSALTRNIGDQLMEFIECQQEGKPQAIRRKECVDIVQAAQKMLNHIDAEPRLRQVAR
jgi:hypothetical protein